MKNLYLIILLLFSISTFAQKILIEDTNTKKPIPNVIITYGENFTVTDSEGIAEINGDKNFMFMFKHTSYKTKLLKYEDIKSKEFIITMQKEIYDVEQVTITANKWLEIITEYPSKITVLDIGNISNTNPQTTADLLSNSNEIFVQKSQLGGGSPMIRGFAANRILIVVDGVRMNNAIYRSGNLQNIISIDPNNLSQAEIIYGPSSVIYGSDAIGGVMDFHTKLAQLSTNNKLHFDANTLLRYSTANQEKTGHFDFSIGLKKFAIFSSVSYSEFDDLKMGKIKHPNYTRNEYVDLIDNKDSILQNPDINIQKFSGFKQLNLLEKIRFKPNNNWEINYSFHYSTTSDIPRYDRLIQYNDEELKYAKWYYGPQKWLMNNLHIENSRENLFYNQMRIVAAYQNYSESRHDRKLNKEEIRNKYENVKIGSLNIDFIKKFNQRNSLYYGVEGLHNIVGSIADKTNIYTNETEPYASRYPDGSTYNSISAYTQYKYKINEHWLIDCGIRYSYIELQAQFDTSFYQFPFEEINSNTDALNGTVGLIYKTNKNLIFSLSGSTGFRAPNIDDIGKVFDSEPGNVIVPNPDLESEYIYSGEISIYKKSKKFYLEIVGFYSYLNNAMIRSDFTFNGQDSIMYDGVLSKVEAFTNKDHAIIYGGQIAIGFKFLKFFKLKTNYNYTVGYDKEELPIRHVPPQFGATHLTFKTEKVKIDIYSVYNGEISNKNLAESEKDKSYMYAADNNGNSYSPAWWTLNFRASYTFKKYVSLNFGVENILDHRYRPYSSGIVAAGRNFIFSISAHI